MDVYVVCDVPPFDSNSREDVGRKQAVACAENLVFLANAGVRLFSSKNAKQTAEEIADHLALEVTEFPRLGKLKRPPYEAGTLYEAMLLAEYWNGSRDPAIFVTHKDVIDPWLSDAGIPGDINPGEVIQVKYDGDLQFVQRFKTGV